MILMVVMYVVLIIICYKCIAFYCNIINGVNHIFNFIGNRRKKLMLIN